MKINQPGETVSNLPTILIKTRDVGEHFSYVLVTHCLSVQKHATKGNSESYLCL